MFKVWIYLKETKMEKRNVFTSNVFLRKFGILVGVASLLIVTFVLNYIHYQELIDFGNRHNLVNIEVISVELGILGTLIAAYSIVFSVNRRKILGHTVKIWILRNKYDLFWFSPLEIIMYLFLIFLLSIFFSVTYYNVVLGVLLVCFMGFSIYLLYLIWIIVDKESRIIKNIKSKIENEKYSEKSTVINSIFNSLCAEYLIYTGNEKAIERKHNEYFWEEIGVVLEIKEKWAKQDTSKRKCMDEVIFWMFYLENTSCNELIWKNEKDFKKISIKEEIKPIYENAYKQLCEDISEASKTIQVMKNEFCCNIDAEYSDKKSETIEQERMKNNVSKRKKNRRKMKGISFSVTWW